MAASKSESDVILNRANVALARSQRLVASWLPAPTEDELANTKSEEELRREEDEIFTAVPETLGVGAPLPEKAADGSWNRTELSSNDKLRKQLLGRNYDKIMKASATNPANKGAAPGFQAGKTAPSAAPTNQDAESDDDEEGRTALVGKKRRRVSASIASKDSQSKDPSEEQEGTPSTKRCACATGTF
ncbi:hypothetical protein N7468_006401 [Penicillium chermesinum]|uniref:Uncharacterized protein n=1 Tax=Penicillium chermesinum TaxID=63820 RepID=A0A9W9NSW6_9EURO|nr:uncharacterized protein N7468_006401 [Penicillium chermesinum]KAJ5225176.1 hypothetical protein N7468_006401 [Penicillium chermesinum]